MDFITGLPLSEGFNAILTVICRLIKERHYIPCHSGDNGTSTRETVRLMIQFIYRLHGLPSSIISDRGPQFISVLWKAFYRELGITVSLSTAYYPETDGQSERANQDIERSMRTYCNYMQDDWARWLPIYEFSDNNNTSSSTRLSPFFYNKGFHPRMSFSPDATTYDTTRERLQSSEAKDISQRMQEILDFGKKSSQASQLAMQTRVNQHRKDVGYEVGGWVWLSSKNIKSTRPCKDLEDKQLGPYQVIGRVGTSYRLNLPKSILRIHNVFSPKVLRPYADDPLPGQKQDEPKPLVIDDEEHWNVDDILDSRRYRGRL